MTRLFSPSVIWFLRACEETSRTFLLERDALGAFPPHCGRPPGGEDSHSMHDVCMSAFAMMFFQDPSLLQFQRRMEEEAHGNNLKTLFHVESIPKDSQMKDALDEVDPEQIAPLFDDFFRPLQRGKHLEQYRVLDGRYIVAVDGSQYFGSEKISCPGCLIREDKKGKVRYSHQIVQAAIMNPNMRQVIPLSPEEVKNADGKEKQDCEINAGKRRVLLERDQRHRHEHHPGDHRRGDGTPRSLPS